MTVALEGGEWSAACPGRNLLPGKTRYLFYRRLGGPQGRSGRVRSFWKDLNTAITRVGQFKPTGTALLKRGFERHEYLKKFCFY